MSGAHQRALWANRHLSATETAILTRLASHAKNDGTGIWPSQADTCAATKYSRRAYYQVIGDAKARGILLPDGFHGKAIQYRMSIEAIRSYNGAAGAPEPVQEVHQGPPVQEVHSTSAPSAPESASGAPPFPNSSRTPQTTPKRQEGGFNGHGRFHQIEGVNHGHDHDCDRLTRWVVAHPEYAPHVAGAIESIVEQVEYDPEGGKRLKGGPYLWRYRGPKGLKWYKDIVLTTQNWARYASERNGTRATPSGPGGAANTTDAVRAAREKVRGG